jgi:integrase
MAKRRANHEGSIRQRKDGTWEAIISIGHDPVTGKLKRVSFYGKTQKEVVEKAATARTGVARGTFVEPSRMPVGEWLDFWLVTYKAPRLRQTTLDGYALIVRRHLQPALGQIPLQDLRPERIQRYLNEKSREGFDANTIRLHYVVLSNALTQAEKVGRVARNVCRLVEPPPRRRKERSTLTMAQVRAQLLEALRAERLAPAFLTLFMTGLRRGELLGLRWQDVDLHAGTLQVRQTLARVTTAHSVGKKTVLVFLTPKTEQSRRTVALPAECVTALRQYKARQAQEKLAGGQGYHDYGLVFCREDGRPIDPRSMNRYFAQALKRAGLPSIRLHDCRHTFATWLLKAGVPLKVVSDQLGHSSITITADVYSHVTTEVAKQAAAVLNAAFTS